METFVLASKSDFELEAVRRALIQVGVRDATVFGIDPPVCAGDRSVYSGKATEHAAFPVYRILDMFRENVKIGVGGTFSNHGSLRNESFLVEAVMLITPPGREILAMCPAISLKLQELGGLGTVHWQGMKEIGQFLAEQFGADPNDPHLYLTNGRVSRMDTLIAGLAIAFKQL